MAIFEQWFLLADSYFSYGKTLGTHFNYGEVFLQASRFTQNTWLKMINQIFYYIFVDLIKHLKFFLNCFKYDVYLF